MTPPWLARTPVRGTGAVDVDPATRNAVMDIPRGYPNALTAFPGTNEPNDKSREV